MALAAAVAVLLRSRQRTAPPTQPLYSVPTQLDRVDFDDPARPWLVAVFTSTACERCVEAAAKAFVVASAEVVVHEISYQQRKDLHQRYRIDAVPTIVVADADGVVRASFVGVPTATDLWAAVAEARAPGSSPEPDLGRGA